MNSTYCLAGKEKTPLGEHRAGLFYKRCQMLSATLLLALVGTSILTAAGCPSSARPSAAACAAQSASAPISGPASPARAGTARGTARDDICRAVAAGYEKAPLVSRAGRLSASKEKGANEQATATQRSRILRQPPRGTAFGRKSQAGRASAPISDRDFDKGDAEWLSAPWVRTMSGTRSKNRSSRCRVAAAD